MGRPIDEPAERKGLETMRLRDRVAASAAFSLLFVACGSASDPVATPASKAARAAKSAAPIAPPSASAPLASASVAPEPEPPRPTFHGKESVRAFVDANVAAFGAHAPEQIAALYAPRAVIASPGPNGLEEATPASMKRDLAALFEAFPDAKLSTVRLYQAGHVAVWEWVVRGTNEGEFMGHPPTKKPIGYHGVSVLSFDAEGLVRRETMYFDFATVEGQLGLGSKKIKARAAEGATAAAEEAEGGHDGSEDIPEITAFYAAVDRHDDKAVAGLVTDDFTMSHLATPADVAKKDFLKGVHDAAKAFPDAKTDEIACFRFAPELIACETAWSATWKGPAMGMKPTQKRGVVHAIDLVRFSGGKIAKITSFSNSVEMLSSFGAAEPPPKQENEQVKLQGKAAPPSKPPPPKK